MLKQEFEKDAIQEMKESDKPVSVVSRVRKENESSRQRNAANGYTEHEEMVEGEKTGFFQYYKDYFPENFKEKTTEEKSERSEDDRNTNAEDLTN